MDPPRSTPRSWRRGAPLMLLLVVLGGLFAMHGPGNHGAAHHPPGTPSAHTSHAAHSPGHPAPDTLTEGAPIDGSLSGYAALCLALLTVGSIVLRRSGHRGLAVLIPRARPPASVVRAVAARRDHDPPSLTRLSINRC